MPSVIKTPSRGTNFAFLVSEAEGYRSREEAVIASGAGVLLGGTVLGRLIAGSGSDPVVTANPDNIGNATVGSLSEPDAQDVGYFRLQFVDATHYDVLNPRMEKVGEGVVGTAYTGEGPAHTVTAGSTAMRVGDFFEISSAYDTGGGFVGIAVPPTSPDPSDGSDVFAGILCEDVDATSAAIKRTIIARDAEVQRSELKFPTALTAAQLATVFAAMAAAHIVLR